MLARNVAEEVSSPDRHARGARVYDMPMRTALVTSLLAASALAVSCGGESVDPIATYPYPPDGGFDHAGHGGTLVREGNCLYFESPDGRYFIAFPEGIASWEDNRLIVDGVTFREGDIVRFGGGAVWPPGSAWVAPPDEDCDLTNVWRASHPF
jgi:hypothetical protein